MKPIPDRPFDPTPPIYDPSVPDYEAVSAPRNTRELPYKQLLASIASETGMSEAAVEKILNAMKTTIWDSVAKGTKVSIPGWISFEGVSTPARTGRNPQTGAEIKIPPGKRIRVKLGSKLKAAGVGVPARPKNETDRPNRGKPPRDRGDRGKGMSANG